MRKKIIVFLKFHPKILDSFWKMASLVLRILSLFLPINKKKMIFMSFGGRKFNDSPKALYDEICNRKEFKKWDLVWAFVEPDKFEINRGRKVKVDTVAFFKELLSSYVWISNTSMSRGIDVDRNGIIKVETWHGTPLKKIGGDENQNSMIAKNSKNNKKLDNKTIRCAQSNYDLKIFSRIFHASKSCFLLSDLPRNDALLKYDLNQKNEIRKKLNIKENKKVILYTPTYREYLINTNKENYISPPIDLLKWKKEIGNEYVLLFRAHYVVTKAMNIKNDDFVIDVTDYPNLNDLYIISDLMISDYSSTFIDYSILERPMLCFAYDLDEYKEKRGLYLDIKKYLPCKIDENEDDLLAHIKTLDFDEGSMYTRKFKKKFAPYAGNACNEVINEILKKIHN